MKGIYIGLPLWGADHVALWHDVTLPMMLAPGNLPGIARLAPTTILIYTDAEDRERIEALPLMPRLRDICAVEFTVIGANPFEFMQTLHPEARHGGTCFKNCQNEIVRRAWDDDCGYICWHADTMWANSGAAKIAETLNADKRALMSVGYCASENFVAFLKGHKRGDVIDMAPGTMSQGYLAAISGGWLPPSIDDPNFGSCPGNLRWSTGDGRGMLLRPHHVNVCFLYAERGPAWCAHGADNELAELALTDYSQVLAVTESNEHMIVGVNVLGHSGFVAAPGRTYVFPPYSPEHAAVYLKVATSEWHRHWMKQYWWCHDGTLAVDDPLRLSAELESDKAILAILDAYAHIMDPANMTPELQEAERKMRHWDY